MMREKVFMCLSFVLFRCADEFVGWIISGKGCFVKTIGPCSLNKEITNYKH